MARVEGLGAGVEPFLLAAGGALEGEHVGIVHDPVADRIRDGRIAQRCVPVACVELTRDDGRGAVVAVFEYLQHVAALRVLERRDQEVVQDKDLDLGDLGEQTRVRPIGARDGELLEEPRHAGV